MLAKAVLAPLLLYRLGLVEALQRKPIQYLPGTSATLMVVVLTPVEVMTESMFELAINAPVESYMQMKFCPAVGVTAAEDTYHQIFVAVNFFGMYVAAS